MARAKLCANPGRFRRGSAREPKVLAAVHTSALASAYHGRRGGDSFTDKFQFQVLTGVR